ncbi:MAG: SpoIIE family protein phosphatase [Leptospiraceae bacterium]
MPESRVRGILFLFCLALTTQIACKPAAEPARVDFGSSPIYVEPGFRDSLLTNFAPTDRGRIYASFPIAPLDHFPVEHPGKLIEFTFFIPFTLSDAERERLVSPAIFFPGLGENYVIYMNGEEIASELHIQGGEIQKRRTELSLSVPIKRELLQAGDNLLVIRLLGHSPPGGDAAPVPGMFYDGGYFLGEQWDVRNSGTDTFNLILVSLYLAFGIYYLLVFFRRPRELYGLYFFLFTLGTFGFYFFRTRIAYDLIDDTENLTRWENASIFLLPGVLMLFLITYLRYREKIPVWGWIVGGVNALFSLLALTVPFSLVSFLVEIWRLLQIPLMVWLPIFHVLSIRRKDRDAGRFMAALVLLLSAAVFDLINSIYHLISMEPTFRWGFFGYALLLVTIMGNRFLVSLRESEQLNEKLEAARVELEEAARMRDTFVAAASHEIRTPVHGILGISRILLMENQPGGEGLSPSLRHSLELIRESAVRLSRLVDDFVDHSRLKEGQLKINRSAVRLHPVVEYCIASVGNQLNQPLELINSVEEEIPPLYADELRLQQILINLLSNAIKFTREGTVRVSATLNKGTVEIAVSDTGIGIPADKLEEVFKPFNQANAAIARTYGGTGLGLYIVRRLVELHEGTLDLESRPGRGSRFSFRLPLYDFAGRPMVEQSAPSGRALKQFRLLEEVTRESASTFKKEEKRPAVVIVDDERINAAVLRGILEPAGFDIIMFRNARDAIYYFQTGGRVDLAILDLMLGGMSGLDLCLWIRESYSSVDLPVLILTAHGDNDRMVEGFAAGANDYLEKPVDPVELLARVRTLVDLRFSTREKTELLSYRQELQIARKIHMELLPSELPVLDQLCTKVRYLPRGDLGGDYYDVQLVDSGAVAILADVTGHGIAAALGAAMIRVAFLLQREHWQRPDQVLYGVNRILLDVGSSQLVTAVCAFVDLSTNTLHLARAGHLPAALLRADGSLEVLFPRGRVMGWLRDLNLAPLEYPFQPGDRLVLFTDGVTELRNSGGEFLGEERILEFLEKNGNLTSDELSDSLMDFVHSWHSEPEDDIAVLVLEHVQAKVQLEVISSTENQ